MYTKCNLSNATMNLYMRLICNKPVCFYKQWSSSFFCLGGVAEAQHQAQWWGGVSRV